MTKMATIIQPNINNLKLKSDILKTYYNATQREREIIMNYFNNTIEEDSKNNKEYNAYIKKK